MSSQINLELWKTQITTELSKEQTSKPMNSSDENWEWLDSEMVKLGSLSHMQFDAQRALTVALQLLETRTKDIRVLLQLIRILQHGIRPQEVIASLILLNEYVYHFWESAYPIEVGKKIRFLEPVLKRYQSIWDKFTDEASDRELDESNQITALLKTFFDKNNLPKIALYFEKMTSSSNVTYSEDNFKSINDKVLAQDSQSKQDIELKTNSFSSNEGIQKIHQQFIGLNPNDEKEFKKAQQMMATMLVELYADLPIGYRLSRHALWSTITSLPQANHEGRTPLAAMSVDLVDMYLNRISNPDVEIWSALEKSISMAPFWFDGHYISSIYAKKLGYQPVSIAIREELSAFIKRLKGIEKLKFNDKTPFMNDETLSWLSEELVKSSPHNPNVLINSGIVENSGTEFGQGEDLSNQNFEEKLQRMELEARNDLKGVFNQQLLLAQELEAKGFFNLAKQQYSTLRLQLQHTTMSEWEQSLISFLESKIQ